MKIFEAVVIRINEIPSETNSFTQKEIIVTPYSPDREITSEYIAIPPSVFPTDAFGSGMVSLPSLNQRCIVVHSSGYRRVQILSFIPFPTTGSYGEYTPVDVSAGGVAFKIGGTKPMVMYFHKGGRWELFSNEFCKLYLDGTKRSYYLSIDTEERVFAGGRVLNTQEEIDGIENSTRHVEVYTKSREWKQNSDVRIAGEKSVLNPESTIMPLPSYSYVPKVIIKAGVVVHNFDSNLGVIPGHLYEIETRQSTYSGDKDTVTSLKLGRQSEMYKYDNDRVYGAGTLFEWSGKAAQITSAISRVSTHVLRYGQLDKDVIANGASVEYTQGEVYRNQSYTNIVDISGAPIIDILAEGKGYEYEFVRNGATEQYTQSFGQLISQNLIGNGDFLYNSVVREHFHVFENHSVANIPNPTGISYKFVLFGKTETEDNIFLKQYERLQSGQANYVRKEHFTENEYSSIVEAPNRSTSVVLDAQKYETIVHITENIELRQQIETDLYKNYVKLDGQHERTEEFVSASYNMTILLGSQTYNIKFEENSVVISLDTGDIAHSPSITMGNEGFKIDPGEGNVDAGNIIIGGGAGPQPLATLSFITSIFANHIHPTAGPGAPTLPPIPVVVPNSPDSPLNTYTEQIKGE